MRLSNKKKNIIIIISFLIVSFIFFFLVLGVNIVKINGDSMNPLLMDKEYVLYRSATLGYKRGDIILFEREDNLYIKRLYGLPGDTIEITDNGLVLINGAPFNKNNFKVIGKTNKNDINDSVKIENNEYFVLGDNRSVSKDSRDSEFGNVKEDEIVGVLIFKKNK